MFLKASSFELEGMCMPYSSIKFQILSGCLVETCVSTVLVSCFLFREPRLLEDLVFGGRFVGCSWIAVTTEFNFSTDGSSGGTSGQGVRFDGTVISRGGSIIHLQRRCAEVKTDTQ